MCAIPFFPNDDDKVSLTTAMLYIFLAPHFCSYFTRTFAKYSLNAQGKMEFGEKKNASNLINRPISGQRFLASDFMCQMSSQIEVQIFAFHYQMYSLRENREKMHQRKEIKQIYVRSFN